MDIFKLLKRGATDAAGLSKAAGDARGALAAARGRERDADAARRAAIIAGDEKALGTAETALVAARLEVERLMIASEELARRAAEAEAAEARAALDAEREAVERMAAAIASKLRKDYSEAGARIVALLTELQEAEQAVREINRKVVEAGRDDVVPAVEARVLGVGRNAESVASLVVLTSLRPVGACPGWGQGRDVARDFGLPR